MSFDMREVNHPKIKQADVAEGQPDPTKYHRGRDGTHIPLNPTIDPNGGLSQFTVVDYDGDTVVNRQEPQTQDEGEDECQPTQTESSRSPSSKAKPASSRQPAGPQKKLIAELQQSVNELSETLRKTTTDLKASIQALSHSLQSSVAERLDSLMSDLELKAAQTKTSLFHPLTDEGWRITFEGSFGSITVSPAVVDIRSETTVVVLYDPDKPVFVPARSDDSVSLTVTHGDNVFNLEVRPNGWSSPVLLGDKDYLLVVMSVLE